MSYKNWNLSMIIKLFEPFTNRCYCGFQDSKKTLDFIVLSWVCDRFFGGSIGEHFLSLSKSRSFIWRKNVFSICRHCASDPASWIISSNCSPHRKFSKNITVFLISTASEIFIPVLMFCRVMLTTLIWFRTLRYRTVLQQNGNVSIFCANASASHLTSTSKVLSLLTSTNALYMASGLLRNGRTASIWLDHLVLLYSTGLQSITYHKHKCNCYNYDPKYKLHTR